MNKKGHKGHASHVKKGKVEKRLDKKIKKVTNGILQLKYNDVEENAVPVPNTGTINSLLDDIATGNDNKEDRIGQEIHLTSVQIRGYIQTEPTCPDPVRVRMIMFWDRQNNNVNPSIIYNGTGVRVGLLDGSVESDPILMPYLYECKDRFTPVLDKTFTLNPNTWSVYNATTPATVTVSSYLSLMKSFSHYIKLGRKVKYNVQAAQTAPITSVMTNNLYLTYFSDQTDEDNQPFVNFNTRVYYRSA